MKVETYKLYKEKNSPYFVSYLIDDYKEYQKGKKRPAVIICPGGGYLKLSEREGEPIALAFLQKGYHAFVLNYSIGAMDGTKSNMSPKAVLELAMTIKELRDNGDKWLVDTSNIVLTGFSAGAHVIAMFSNRWSEPWIAKRLGTTSEKLRVKAVVLGYPLCDIQVMVNTLKNDVKISDDLKNFLELSMIALCGEKYPGGEKAEYYSPTCLVNEYTPPTFIWHTADDEMVSAENSLLYALQLSRYQIPYEVHIFENGVHGLALANEFTACRPEEVNLPCQEWIQLLFAWLEKRIIMEKNNA